VWPGVAPIRLSIFKGCGISCRTLLCSGLPVSPYEHLFEVPPPEHFFEKGRYPNCRTWLFSRLSLFFPVGGSPFCFCSRPLVGWLVQWMYFFLRLQSPGEAVLGLHFLPLIEVSTVPVSRVDLTFVFHQPPPPSFYWCPPLLLGLSSS